MKKYRYIRKKELIEASVSAIFSIKEALEKRRYRIMGLASRYVAGSWKINNEAFVHMILAHLAADYCLFEKVIENPPPKQEFFHGNIRRDPNSENEDDDVYVELRLQNNYMIIIADAHIHTSDRRLPK